MRIAWLSLLVLGCSPAPFECANDPATPLPDAAAVCAHIESIGCFIDPDPELEDAGLSPSCELGYDEVSAALSDEEFARVLRCYMAAEACEDLEGCNQSCGPGGGHISYRPGVDAGAPIDAGSDAAAPNDAGSDAAAPNDAGSDAAAPNDAGSDAAAPTDAG